MDDHDSTAASRSIIQEALLAAVRARVQAEHSLIETACWEALRRGCGVRVVHCADGSLQVTVDPDLPVVIQHFID